jgi:hypothetical protein
MADRARNLPLIHQFDRKLMLAALSYAISWNDSLIDAHIINGSVIDKELVDLCKSQNDQFKQLMRDLRMQASLRRIENGN